MAAHAATETPAHAETLDANAKLMRVRARCGRGQRAKATHHTATNTHKHRHQLARHARQSKKVQHTLIRPHSALPASYSTPALIGGGPVPGAGAPAPAHLRMRCALRPGPAAECARRPISRPKARCARAAPMDCGLAPVWPLPSNGGRHVPSTAMQLQPTPMRHNAMDVATSPHLPSVALTGALTPHAMRASALFCESFSFSRASSHFSRCSISLTWLIFRVRF